MNAETANDGGLNMILTDIIDFLNKDSYATSIEKKEAFHEGQKDFSNCCVDYNAYLKLYNSCHNTVREKRDAYFFGATNCN